MGNKEHKQCCSDNNDLQDAIKHMENRLMATLQNVQDQIAAVNAVVTNIQAEQVKVAASITSEIQRVEQIIADLKAKIGSGFCYGTMFVGITQHTTPLTDLLIPTGTFLVGLLYLVKS